MTPDDPEDAPITTSKREIDDYVAQIKADVAAEYEEKIAKLQEGAKMPVGRGEYISKKLSGIDEVVKALLKDFPEPLERTKMADYVWGWLTEIIALANIEAKDTEAFVYRWLRFRINFVAGLAPAENELAEYFNEPLVCYDSRISRFLDNLENWMFMQLTRAKDGNLSTMILGTVTVTKETFGAENPSQQQSPSFFSRLRGTR